VFHPPWLGWGESKERREVFCVRKWSRKRGDVGEVGVG